MYRTNYDIGQIVTRRIVKIELCRSNRPTVLLQRILKVTVCYEPEDRCCETGLRKAAVGSDVLGGAELEVATSLSQLNSQ